MENVTPEDIISKNRIHQQGLVLNLLRIRRSTLSRRLRTLGNSDDLLNEIKSINWQIDQQKLQMNWRKSILKIKGEREKLINE